MRSVVTGLMLLAGAVAREKGHGFDDMGWRREVQQAREAQEADAATAEAATGDGQALRASRAALMTVSVADVDSAPGEWDVACVREEGDRLVFDRESVREMGNGTLFRWAPTDGAAPTSDGTIYTALADCGGKSIEASWPGKRTETRDGTCGRHLVEAACAVRASRVPETPAIRKSVGGGGGLRAFHRAFHRKIGALHVSAAP
jgi:hypothetical protein